MTRNIEKVSVLAGGSLYTEWEAVEISYALNEAAREFSLQGTEHPGQFRFPPGTPVAIMANGQMVLNGYVNKYAPQGDATRHTVTISGRSRSQDYVDNSAVHETGFWENQTPDKIATELDKFGVGIKAEVPLEKVPYWQLSQGESPWRTIDRMTRPQGVVQRGTAEGGIAITNAKAAKQHSGALIEGHNILQFQGEITDDLRHSEYTVKGQGRKGHGEPYLRPFGQMMDGFVKRYRPKIIINEQDTDKNRAQKRAEFEANQSAGMSVKAIIVTQGWRDDGGKVWDTNSTIFVMSPILLKLVQPMLIERVQLTQDQNGSVATLQLVDPRAYQGKGGGGSGEGAESDGAWGPSGASGVGYR